MIFTRKTEENRYRLVSIVINTDKGIRDCFGFFDVSQFERDKILERFLKNETACDIPANNFKVILNNAEVVALSNSPDGWKLPYEYVCWRNLLIDIDYEDELIEQALKTQVLPKCSEEVFDLIEKSGISKRWFFDEKYSDETENLMRDLKGAKDLDSLVSIHIDKIFNQEEILSWDRKLILSAYIRYSSGFDSDAELIYGLVQSEANKKKLFINILKRSIYEYLMFIKYNKDANLYDISSDEICDKIEYIESKWVGNV